MFRITLVLIATLSFICGPDPRAFAGQIKGVARLIGQAPPRKALDMKADPFCAAKSAKEEELIAGPQGALKNVVVRVVKGAPAGTIAASAAVVLDQDGCSYRPRVAVAQAGQEVLIKNSDQTLHNVHTYRGAVTLSNQAQPQSFPPIKQQFPTAGDVIKFKCDVHPWMTGWVVVTDNSFFAVTAEDGAFVLDKLPPGSYTIQAWHETLGTQTREVKVVEGKPVVLKLDFAIK